MTEHHDQHEPADDGTPLEDTLPAALVDALRATDGPAPLPSAEHDDALLAEARAHLAQHGVARHAQRGRSRYVLAVLGAGGALAAAAAVVFAVWIGQPGGTKPAGPAVADRGPDTGDTQPDRRRPTDAGRTPPTPGPLPNPDDGTAARPPRDGNPLARPGGTPDTSPPGDLDGSGTVDILDAFALARAIERGEAPARDRASDFNNDGRVDQQDADWLAEQAVALTRNGGRG